MKDTEWTALAERLSSDQKAVQRRAAHEAATLAQSDGDLLQRLLASLDPGAPFGLRWGAAFALSLLGEVPEEALATLLDALGRDDGDLRWAAADLVKRLARTDAGTRVVGQLTALASRGSPAQRKMALYCLRDLETRDAAVLAAVDVALTAHETEVRLAGLSTIAALATDRGAAAERILKLVGDADAGVRRAAVATLGTLGERTEVVLGVLRVCATSEDASLRRAATRSLEMLGGRETNV